MPGHHALQGVTVTAEDFVSNAGTRPQTHGTAVASLVSRSAAKTAHIYSASVFFQAEGFAPGATAESLVAALDWMVSERVDVVNMSLAGPGNALLEAAVGAMLEQQVPLVAAVGNAGPAAPPMYPAAYDKVIGVTAVDQKNKVFRYANRGDYVDFAARGVNVKVADSTTGGYRVESGTSMASPHVAVVVAKLVRESSVHFDALSSWLATGAEDLGRKGLDTTFGHGLITQTPVVLSGR
jgi:subtilisin family serine protease